MKKFLKKVLKKVFEKVKKKWNKNVIFYKKIKKVMSLLRHRTYFFLQLCTSHLRHRTFDKKPPRGPIFIDGSIVTKVC